MKIVVIPDSFKGTMSSKKICDISEKAIRDVCADAGIKKICVADGGEGSVNAFVNAVGGEICCADVAGPYFEKINAKYAVLSDKKTAVIEMAACAGLELVGDKKNPLLTTTYGVGQLIKKAIESGCSKIILCLGGSATNDAGCGAAAALGAVFSDENGNEFVPTGGTLCKVRDIDISSLKKMLYNIDVSVMCDVTNPMYGKEGAAYIFAPQKGADECQVKTLDEGLEHISECILRCIGIDIKELAGAGAAGGFGGGACAFFGGKLCSGIEVLLNAVNFDKILEDTDLVITGEGKLDKQSLDGKVISGIVRRCSASGVPAVAVVGDIDDGAEVFYDKGLCGIFSINKLAVTYEQSKKTAEKDLYFTVKNIMHFIKNISNI